MYFPVRFYLAICALVLGGVWFGIDVSAGQPWSGLSYLFAAIGLAGVVLLGLSGWQQTICAYVVASLCSTISLTAVWIEHAGASTAMVREHIAIRTFLTDVAFGQGLAMYALPASQQMATAMLSSGACATNDVRMVSDMAGKLWLALYLEPLPTVLFRTFGWVEGTPRDDCVHDRDRLLDFQPDLAQAIVASDQ